MKHQRCGTLKSLRCQLSNTRRRKQAHDTTEAEFCESSISQPPVVKLTNKQQTIEQLTKVVASTCKCHTFLLTVIRNNPVRKNNACHQLDSTRKSGFPQISVNPAQRKAPFTRREHRRCSWRSRGRYLSSSTCQLDQCCRLRHRCGCCKKSI